MERLGTLCSPSSTPHDPLPEAPRSHEVRQGRERAKALHEVLHRCRTQDAGVVGLGDVHPHRALPLARAGRLEKRRPVARWVTLGGQRRV